MNSGFQILVLFSWAEFVGSLGALLLGEIIIWLLLSRSAEVIGNNQAHGSSLPVVLSGWGFNLLVIAGFFLLYIYLSC